MKGFVEVTKVWADTKEKAKVLVSINAIYSVGKVNNYIGIEFSNSYMYVQETYEEIKQKIKQATEPRLMIDEKGNLKEMK